MGNIKKLYIIYLFYFLLLKSFIYCNIYNAQLNSSTFMILELNDCLEEYTKKFDNDFIDINLFEKEGDIALYGFICAENEKREFNCPNDLISLLNYEKNKFPVYQGKKLFSFINLQIPINEYKEYSENYNNTKYYLLIYCISKNICAYQMQYNVSFNEIYLENDIQMDKKFYEYSRSQYYFADLNKFNINNKNMTVTLYIRIIDGDIKFTIFKNSISSPGLKKEGKIIYKHQVIRWELDINKESSKDYECIYFMIYGQQSLCTLEYSVILGSNIYEDENEQMYPVLNFNERYFFSENEVKYFEFNKNSKDFSGDSILVTVFNPDYNELIDNSIEISINESCNFHPPVQFMINENFTNIKITSKKKCDIFILNTFNNNREIIVENGVENVQFFDNYQSVNELNFKYELFYNSDFNSLLINIQLNNTLSPINVNGIIISEKNNYVIINKSIINSELITLSYEIKKYCSHDFCELKLKFNKNDYIESNEVQRLSLRITKIQDKERIPIYIPKNILIQDFIFPEVNNIYYTELNSTNGEIMINSFMGQVELYKLTLEETNLYNINKELKKINSSEENDWKYYYNSSETNEGNNYLIFQIKLKGTLQKSSNDEFYGYPINFFVNEFPKNDKDINIITINSNLLLKNIFYYNKGDKNRYDNHDKIHHYKYIIDNNKVKRLLIRVQLNNKNNITELINVSVKNKENNIINDEYKYDNINFYHIYLNDSTNLLYKTEIYISISFLNSTNNVRIHSIVEYDLIVMPQYSNEYNIIVPSLNHLELCPSIDNITPKNETNKFYCFIMFPEFWFENGFFVKVQNEIDLNYSSNYKYEYTKHEVFYEDISELKVHLFYDDEAKDKVVSFKSNSNFEEVILNWYHSFLYSNPTKSETIKLLIIPNLNSFQTQELFTERTNYVGIIKENEYEQKNKFIIPLKSLKNDKSSFILEIENENNNGELKINNELMPFEGFLKYYFTSTTNDFDNLEIELIFGEYQTISNIRIMLSVDYEQYEFLEKELESKYSINQTGTIIYNNQNLIPESTTFNIHYNVKKFVINLRIFSVPSSTSYNEIDITKFKISSSLMDENNNIIFNNFLNYEYLIPEQIILIYDEPDEIKDKIVNFEKGTQIYLKLEQSEFKKNIMNSVIKTRIISHPRLESVSNFDTKFMPNNYFYSFIDYPKEKSIQFNLYKSAEEKKIKIEFEPSRKMKIIAYVSKDKIVLPTRVNGRYIYFISESETTSSTYFSTINVHFNLTKSEEDSSNNDEEKIYYVIKYLPLLNNEETIEYSYADNENRKYEISAEKIQSPETSISTSWPALSKTIVSKYFLHFIDEDELKIDRNNYISKFDNYSIFYHFKNKIKEDISNSKEYSTLAGNEYQYSIEDNKKTQYDYDYYILSFSYENNEEIIVAYKSDNINHETKSIIFWLIPLLIVLIGGILTAGVYLFRKIKDMRNEEEMTLLTSNEHINMEHFDEDDISGNSVESFKTKENILVN